MKMKNKFFIDSPGSKYFKLRAKCVNCNGMYRVSARGGLRGAGGDADDEPGVAPGPNGHKNARCNSHPTSDIILAFRKYGVTSRKNLTEMRQKKNNLNFLKCHHRS